MATYDFGDYAFAVSRGLVPGVTGLNKFGQATNIDILTAPMDIWAHGGLWVPPTAAVVHNIVSTNAADAVAGVGARTVQIWGLDASYAKQTETIDLAGLVDVPTVNAYSRIYRMSVLTDGSAITATAPANVGAITATAVGAGGLVTASIAALRGQTEMAIYTVAAGMTLHMNQWYLNLARVGAVSGAMAQLVLLIRQGLDTAVNPAWVVKHSIGIAVAGGAVQHEWAPNKTVVGPADVKIQVVSVTDDNSIISSGFAGYLAAS